MSDQTPTPFVSSPHSHVEATPAMQSVAELEALAATLTPYGLRVLHERLPFVAHLSATELSRLGRRFPGLTCTPTESDTEARVLWDAVARLWLARKARLATVASELELDTPHAVLLGESASAILLTEGGSWLAIGPARDGQRWVHYRALDGDWTRIAPAGVRVELQCGRTFEAEGLRTSRVMAMAVDPHGLLVREATWEALLDATAPGRDGQLLASLDAWLLRRDDHGEAHPMEYRLGVARLAGRAPTERSALIPVARHARHSLIQVIGVASALQAQTRSQVDNDDVWHQPMTITTGSGTRYVLEPGEGDRTPQLFRATRGGAIQAFGRVRWPAQRPCPGAPLTCIVEDPQGTRMLLCTTRIKSVIVHRDLADGPSTVH